MAQHVAAREDARARDRLEAAAPLYKGRETDEAIARGLGICRRTLAYWKHHPDFVARYQQLQEEGHARSLGTMRASFESHGAVLARIQDRIERGRPGGR